MVIICSTDQYKIGDKVNVHYDLNHPEEPPNPAIILRIATKEEYRKQCEEMFPNDMADFEFTCYIYIYFYEVSTD